MQYEVDIVTQLREAYPLLRKSEQRAAKVILDDLEFAAQANINQLAAKAEVSEASITRLAKSLGFKNVRDLKFRVAKSITIGQRFLQESPEAESAEDNPLKNTFDVIHQTLEHNAKLLQPAQIEKAVELALKANHVLIFGVGGGSTVMAQEMQHRLFRLGLKSNAYSDPLLMRMTAATLDKNDLVIVLSLSGLCTDILESAQIGQEYGGKVVAISAKGPVSDMADCHLQVETQETDFIFKPSAARYSMLAVIDILATQIAIKTQTKSREKLRRLKYTLDQYRDGDKRLPLGD